MEEINKRLSEHGHKIEKIEDDICTLQRHDTEFEKFMYRTEMRYEHLEKAISKKAEFWDKVKVSITTSVILFFIMWILNSSSIFK